MNKFLISGYLGAGIENALLLRELEALTGMNPREIRRQIQLERLTGVPILSDNLHGYYLAADDWEVTQFVRSMRKRAREILKVAQAVENPALVPDILSSKTKELPTENVTGKEVK